MHRHYFISDDLNDVKATENDLLNNGFYEPQMHVLSEADSELDKYHLHNVNSLMKQDVIHSGVLGALIGAVLALVILAAGMFTEASGAIGWLPFVFLAVVAFAFCVWEGGLFGIQLRNVEFQRFAEVLAQGKHVMLLDVADRQENAMRAIVACHPSLQYGGEGVARPSWMIASQKGWKSFITSMP